MVVVVVDTGLVLGLGMQAIVVAFEVDIGLAYSAYPAYLPFLPFLASVVFA